MDRLSSQTIPDKGLAQELDLWDALRHEGLIQAREALFNRHAAFARALARRAFRQRARGDIDLEDLVQLAYEGLLEAIGRFDPSRNVAFPAFAALRINGNIADGIARMTEIRGQLSWRHRIKRDRMRSLAPDVDNLSIDQALAALGELALGLALGFMLEGTGLVAVRDEEDGEVHAASAFSAFDSLAWKELVKLLDEQLSDLEERDRSILQLHYIQGMAFDQIASLLALSKGRISQLHKASLSKLRKRITARGHFRFEQ